MILWYAAIVFVAGSLHRRWKTPRGAGPSIWFLDLPWGDWSVAIDVASATWQVRACWHSEKAKLEEGRRMQFDDICIYIYTYNHRRIQRGQWPKTWYTRAADSYLVACWNLFRLCFCFFFSRGIQCQTKARSKACSFSCQWDWWSKTRAPRGKISKSQLLDLLLAIYQPPVSWLRWPTWAPTKGCDQRLSQTSFADFLPKRLLRNFTAKAPAWLPSLPSKISSKFLLASCFRAGKSCLMERLFGAKVWCKICLV